MNKHTDDIKLKLAWQTAFELRTCPDSETLHASEPDDNLNRHLAICHVCREKREMTRNEQNVWKSLREKFSTLAMKPGTGTDKHAGQVWTIKKDLVAGVKMTVLSGRLVCCCLKKLMGLPVGGWRSCLATGS